MALMSDDRNVQVEEHHSVGRVNYKFVFNLIRVLVRQFTDGPKEAKIQILLLLPDSHPKHSESC